MEPFLELHIDEISQQPFLEDYKTFLNDGIFIGGRHVEEFEEEFSKYVGAEYCIGCGNGLDALTFSLLAHGIGCGDEVIVPAHTFIATWLSVSHCGAKVVPVDIDNSFLLNSDLLENHINSRTRAIILVHLYGLAYPLSKIREITNKYDLIVIGDAAQAHGARSDGERVGGQGYTTAWSFYPGKNLGAFGDAGAVTTDDKFIADHIRKIRNYGSEQKYVHEIKGHNSRLDAFQAMVLRRKLEKLDNDNNARLKLASVYNSVIRNIYIKKPLVPMDGSHVMHLYVIRTKYRDRLIAYLDSLAIPTLIHYPTPPHRQVAYSEFKDLHFPVAESVARECVSLPLFPKMSVERAVSIGEALNSFNPL